MSLRIIAPWGQCDLVPANLYSLKSEFLQEVPETWALPGCWVGTTAQVHELCQLRGWRCIDQTWARARRRARENLGDDLPYGVSTAYTSKSYTRKQVSSQGVTA